MRQGGVGRLVRRLFALHHADAGLPDDYRAPATDDFAQRAGPVDLPALRHRLPGHAGTIVRNNSIADHLEAGDLEFSRKLSGGHVALQPSMFSPRGAATVSALLRVLVEPDRRQRPHLALQRAVLLNRRLTRTTDAER
jgi:hypothetical protein